MGPQHLQLVAVCHRVRPSDFVSALKRMANRHGVLLRGVIVGNNGEHSLQLAGDVIEYMSGSNHLLDFSGYFEGLGRLVERDPLANSHNVLFVNDSLVTKHAGYSIWDRVVALDKLLQQLRVPAIAGKLDPYRAICMRNPWSGHSGYITSFCFMLNAAALPLMRQLAADAEIDGVLGSAELGDATWGHQLPHDFREMLRAHLLYSDSPFLWPAARSCSPDLLRRKASCSYFEHRLSGHVGKSGAVVPINAGLRSIASIAVKERMARLLKAMDMKIGLR